MTPTINKKTMRAKATCIKADPLGWLEVGRTYDTHDEGKNIIIEGSGMAMSGEQFAEHFFLEYDQPSSEQNVNNS